MKTDVINIPAFLHIFSQDEPFEHYVSNVSKALTFFKKIAPIGPDKSEEAVAFLTRLEKLALDMQNLSENYCIVMRVNGKEINLLPIHKFLEEYPAREVIYIIESIHATFVENSSPDDHYILKKAYDTLLFWKYFFQQIIEQF